MGHFGKTWASLRKLGSLWENLGNFEKTWATFYFEHLITLEMCPKFNTISWKRKKIEKLFYSIDHSLSLFLSFSLSIISLLIFLVRVWTTSCRIMTAVWGRHCLSHRRRRRRPSQASNSRLASRPNYSHHKWIILSATERRRKMTQPWLKIPASFCVFSSFPHDTNQQKLIKA